MEPKHWVPILLILLFTGLFLKVPVLSGFSVMLLVVIGVAHWWRKHALDHVLYRRKPYYTRAFAGERVPLRLEVENRKLLPISWLRIQDHWPRAVGPEDEELLAPTHITGQGLLSNLFSLRWFERSRRNYTLLFRKRGIYPIGPVKMESGDFFGLYEESKEQGPVELLTVFPSLAPLPEMNFAANNPFGDRRSHKRLYEDPNQPIGVRDYHPEDNFRSVHWPLTAHTGSLVVKVFQPTSANVLVICLNVSTFSRHWEGTSSELLEELVKVSASLADQGIQKGHRVGLISNGCLAHADQPFRVPPGRSSRQLASLLTALAGVTPVSMAAFERFLIKEAPRLPYGASLIVVTAVVNAELAESLLQIKRHGRKITLLSLAKDAPMEIPGIHTIHLPFHAAPVSR